MNQSQSNEAHAIREDIDITRRRMDDTMDALGERLEPQHLLDEVLGFFRRSTEGDGKLAHLREKVSHSADTAMHAVIDTVKKNPMPALMIGAGLAWMIYGNRRSRTPEYRDDRALHAGDADHEGIRYDPDTHYDRPLDYPPSEAGSQWSDQGGSKLGHMKDSLAEKTHHAADQVKEKLSHVGDVAREKAHQLRERAGEFGHRVGERTRQAYDRTRDRVATTADHHPLESGLACLAFGIIAGLALPTPNAVNRRIGPTADRLRDRTREAGSEMLQKGKRVAQAAVSAMKQEAQSQGLTPENLREQAGQVAQRATDAGKQAARKEGLSPEANQSGSQVNDPAAARPA